MTLDQKITIKGVLATRGVFAKAMVDASAKHLACLWYRVFPGPIADYQKVDRITRRWAKQRR
jgi:hypothetical protein